MTVGNELRRLLLTQRTLVSWWKYTVFWAGRTRSILMEGELFSSSLLFNVIQGNYLLYKDLFFR